MQNKNIIRIVLGTALILLIPLLVMQFYDDMVWGVADFASAFVLLVGTGLIYELVVRRVKNNATRVAFGVVLVVALLLIWIELAVGIFGS